MIDLLTAGVGLLGGLLGGSESEQTTTKSLDPRLAKYVYGDDGTSGLLGDATNIYRQQMATGGLNNHQRQGLDMQMQYLTSPQYQQSNQQLFNTGSSLLGGGIAGNPFTNGQRSFGGSRMGQGQPQSFGQPQGMGQQQGMSQRQQNQMMPPASQGFQYQPYQAPPDYAITPPEQQQFSESDFETWLVNYLRKQQAADNRFGSGDGFGGGFGGANGSDGSDGSDGPSGTA